MTPRRPFDASRPSRLDPQALPGASVLLAVVVTAVIVAGLYFAREIFVPLALAMLLSFALAPPVRWLRHLHIPRLPARAASIAPFWRGWLPSTGSMKMKRTKWRMSLPIRLRKGRIGYEGHMPG